MYVAESGIWRVRLYDEGGYSFDVAEDDCNGTRHWFMAGDGWAADDDVPKHVARRLVRKARRMAGL